MEQEQKPGVTENRPQGAGGLRGKVRSGSRQTRGRTAPRPASPTRSIEPGIVHFKAAQAILEGVQSRAAGKGVKLDVGEFPELADVAGGDDDPTRVVRLVAHAVARLSDRFPLARKFSRHMEGTEKRAGIISDLTAAAYALYKRNPDAAEQAARAFASEVKARREQVQTKPTERTGQ